MKRGIKILTGIVLFIMLCLILIPVVFEDKILDLVKQNINNNLEAKVDFTEGDLSLFRNFPYASVALKNVTVINIEPFEGDTLFYSTKIDLGFKVTQLLKSTSENFEIKSFNIDTATLNLLVDKNEVSNFDIVKKDTITTDNTSSENNLNFSVEEYSIKKSALIYRNVNSDLVFKIADLNHNGSGDFSTNISELDTKSSGFVSYSLNKTKYLDYQFLDINAVIEADFANKKFTFLNNEGHINKLPLTFNGFVKVNKNNQEIDLNFKTPSSDFKNFLAIIPKQYAQNIADVKTSGNFNVSGVIKGISDENKIPNIDIKINSKNASFKFPSLPKSVQNIQIDTNIKNTTGYAENTFINVNNLSFKIDENSFKGNATIKNLTNNPTVNSTVKGKLNLADIEKVYPIEIEQDLSGIVVADLTSSFDLDAIEKNIYNRIKNSGNVSINNFNYASKEMVNPVNISTAAINFKPEIIKLTNFNAKTGDTDLNATGTINNLLGFLLSDKNLKGNFNVNSTVFKVSDFIENAKESFEENKTLERGKLNIPQFLDCSINANAKKVFYDNLVLENVSGKLILKDQKANLNNVNAGLLDGKIKLNGFVNTQKETSDFDMDLNIDSFDVSKSFSQIQLLESLAPIASVLKGKINTTINLKGNLNQDNTPDLKTISGTALAEILTRKLTTENSKILSLLDQKLNFIDAKKLNLDNLKTSLTFKDGKVNIKPFSLNYKDIKIQFGGTHSLDKNINYNLVFDVPAKYLGTEIVNLLSKLDNSEQNISIPVTANLTGNFSNPTVKTDLQTAVKNLVTQLIKKQKDKFINNTLNDILGSNNNKDSVKTNPKNPVKDVLSNLFGKKKTKKDTVKK